MMHAGGRRSLCVVLVLAFLFSASAAFAESVDLALAQKATEGFLKGRSSLPDGRANGTILALAAASTPAGFREVRDEDGTIIAYVADLEPRGFIALSADTDIAPVIAYSFRGSFPAGTDKANPLSPLLKNDLKLRAKALAESPELKDAGTARLWDILAAGEPGDDASFQQWPPEGTTSTGGWVQTTWVQDEPFNNLCPLDPVDGVRSYVGCVATAFSQVVNYHRHCGITFVSDDAYTTKSGVAIDADCSLYDFPSFSEINGYLDRVRAKYLQGTALDDADMAALSLACGFAVQMGYGSDGSGAHTSAVQTALVGRFGYYSADLFDAITDAGMVALQENMINGKPALLSFSPPDGWGGHVVVCDGYNTNGEYHLNFGWGAEHPKQITEAWYRIPTAILYRDCVFTECVLNIEPTQPPVEVDATSLAFNAAPGKRSEPQILRIRNNVANLRVESITCPDGFLIDRSGQGYAARLGSFTIEAVRQGASVNVAFNPAQAGDYSGVLAIRYSDGGVRNVALKGWAYDGGTAVAAGDVSGAWSRNKSPYFVTDDIAIPKGGKLVIEPGVKVLFAQGAALTVGQTAQLIAQGNDAQPIELTALNRAAGWGGLRFVNSGHDDVLSYCLIRYAKKDAGLDPRSTASDIDLYGGAIYCDTSDPTIENCRITNNTGGKGGAIYCVDSYPIISNTLIANNTSGEVDSVRRHLRRKLRRAGDLELHHREQLPRRAFLELVGRRERDEYDPLGQRPLPTRDGRMPSDGHVLRRPGRVRRRGQHGRGPQLPRPSDGVGAEYDGAAANWALKPNSPCINSGTLIDELPATDLAGAPRTHCEVLDLGAYESQADLALITATPSTTLDAGFVALNSSKTVVVELANTEPRLQDHGCVRRRRRLLPRRGGPEQDRRRRRRRPGQGPVPADAGEGVQGHAHRPLDLQQRADDGDLSSRRGRRRDRRAGRHGQGHVEEGQQSVHRHGRHLRRQEPDADDRAGRGRSVRRALPNDCRLPGHPQGRWDRAGQDPVHRDRSQRGLVRLRFVNSASEDQLKYCTLEYAVKDHAKEGGFDDLCGGAILCTGSEEDEPGYGLITAPTLDSCTIARNLARSGGAIMCYAGGNATLTNNVITDNYSDLDGGAIALYGSDCVIANNVIAHNDSLVGGALINWLSAPTIRNNTIVANKPNAMHLDTTIMPGWPSASVTIVNNIIWQNEIWMSEEVTDGEYLIRYNDVQGGWTGRGNFAVDPLFADAENGDYHLKSKAGRWDPVSKSWVLDSVTSPCIDAGDPSTSIVNEPQPRGLRVNMGAYGGTSQASKSPSGS
jgi:hypothetical protein